MTSPRWMNHPSAVCTMDPLEPRLLMSATYTQGQDIVLYWNQVAMDALLVDSRAAKPQEGGPTKASRAEAIVFSAIADAYAGITGEFSTYLVKRKAPKANVEAAISQAAHDTLSSLFSNQKAEFDADLKNVLNVVPNSKAEKLGVQFGKFVAQRMLHVRKHDHSNNNVTYTPSGLPGTHNVDPLNPNQGFLGPGWGSVTPFVVKSSKQFAPPPFPSMTSAEYTTMFNEVKYVGAADAETADRNGDGQPDRTADQTEIGIFWAYDNGLGTPLRIFDAAAVAVAQQEGNTVGENARLFGMAFLAMADAGITAWQCKYDYDIWRPILGIRNADLDGNPDTIADKNWTPLGAPNHLGGIAFTPPFPSYTSGHATFGGAFFQVMTDFYGTDNIAFNVYSEDSQTTRHFDSFSQAQQENVDGRIYLGVHWRADQTQGDISGRGIGNYVYANVYELK